MTPETHHKQIDQENQETLRELLQEKMKLAVRYTLIQALEEEVEAYIQAAPYERTKHRQDHRNGIYSRSLGTSLGEIEDVPVPRTRKGFASQLFERYRRRQAELDESICQMFVQGVSTEKVGQIVETLSGSHPSPSTVSRVFHTLEQEFASWKKRPLQAHYLYVIADGTYFSVIYAGEGQKMPILAAIGIDAEGTREVLGFSTGDRENQLAWEALLTDFKERGLERVDLWITDGGKAMINAIESKFLKAKRQRCVKHKMENVLGYVPQEQHDQVYPELRAILYQDSLQQAQQTAAAFLLKYENTYPTACDCLRRDLNDCLTFYLFPPKHWRFIRTSNAIERLFQEVKKRSHKMAAAFRNENSCLLLFYAVIRSLNLRDIAVPATNTKPLEILHNS
ncbi:MAG TPA: IS256 family transposase [Anaerolineales bacterium]|nr:IS256 family transposase [Anaerolineales bacterium]